jgi:transcriptional accessory protein Tex/SPT6
MHDVPSLDFARIAQDLQIRKVQVESVVQLLDEGNTVPFITRYRKERTGGLNEEIIRHIQGRIQQQRQLAERKQTVLKSIEAQGKLTDELRAKILAAETPKRLEDLYLPYKPKKRSLATAAREKGLEPLALAIWNRDPAVANLDEILTSMVAPEKELPSVEEVRAGVQHILAELIAETAEVRAGVRAVLWDTGRLCTTKAETVAEGQGLDYKDYFQFTEPVRHIPPHRILAINRGEKEHTLKARIEYDAELGKKVMLEKLSLADHPHAAFLTTVADDAMSRLVLPSLEREVRRELSERAEGHAVHVFARNLRSLLLQPPLHARRVLAIDPGLRTGCKLAVLDEHGNLQGEGVIYPHAPQNKRSEARAKLEELVRAHRVDVIAIGNGTACRQTEELVADLIAELNGTKPPAPKVETTATTLPNPGAAPANEPPALASTEAAVATVETSALAAPDPAPVAAQLAPTAESVVVPAAPQGSDRPPTLPAEAPPPAEPKPLLDVAYVIVNEAGASVYSASPVGREEFPDLDATLRGTISIGRRLQDPLSELVKIDPQNIGVGLYQHDVNPKYLKESLEAVVESSVNHVGVDLNTASVPLLRHVSGFNQLVARELVEYRRQNGPFKSRDQLLQVPGVGPARYVQAAGFLKIAGDNPLDRTWIHPESYPIAERIIAQLGLAPAALQDREQTEALRDKLKGLAPEDVSKQLEVGVPTVRDILEALARPGRDPREDLPPPIFKKGILRLEDLHPGMELKGTVLNVVDFGAFVDIGLKDSGLVHISQMANRYIKSPYDVVNVGEVVTVWVLNVDQERRRVSLTMIAPGTERRPPERRPARPARGEGGPQPPRGEGGGPPPAGEGQAPRGRRPFQGREGGPPPGRGSRQGRGAGPRRGAPPAPEAPPAQAAPAESGAAPAAQQPAARPAPPPRKPQRRPPPPKLTQDALQGKAPLHTFGELMAFFQAKDRPPPPPKPAEGDSEMKVPDAAASAEAPPAPAETRPAQTPTPPE